MEFADFFEILESHSIFSVLVLLVMLDYLTGISSAFLKRQATSQKMIDGLIRKGNMIITLGICLMIDMLMKIDIMSLLSLDVTIGQTLKSLFGVTKIGIVEIIGSGFILAEIISILENLEKCDIKVVKLVTDTVKKIKEKFYNN